MPGTERERLRVGDDRLGKALATASDAALQNMAWAERGDLLHVGRLIAVILKGAGPHQDAGRRPPGQARPEVPRDLQRWQTQLRSMANQLEGMVTQSEHAVWDEIGLPEDFRQ